MPAPALPADQVVELEVEVPPGKIIDYDIRALCSALGIDDPTRVIVETDGIRRGLITIYPVNPLTVIRPVTRDDLVMDRHGRITVGLYHNGRPVRKRLFDPSSGSAQRFALLGTTGAGKSRALQLQLIAEKINGVCTWLADLKEGQSVPEAAGHVDWHTTSQEAALLMLHAAVEVAHARMRRYSKAGRNSFMLGGDPLLHVWIDECNRLLEAGAPYRAAATRLIKELGRTGRSVGVGVGIAAQAAHLEELGGSDTLRAMLKEGEVTLLRWSSSMMRHLVGDGILPVGAQLMPIPKTLAPPKLRSQLDELADEDEDDAPGTQGMGYHLSGPHPTSLMRHFQIGSPAPQPGLDPEILALYGPEPPTMLEEESRGIAGQAYAVRHDPEAVAALGACLREALLGDSEPSTTTTTIITSSGSVKRIRLEDRILRVLTDRGDAMTAEDILIAVNADGGQQVKLGSVRNALVGLVQQEKVVRPEPGRYSISR